MSELKTVILLGALGKRFGKKHCFAIKTPAEAVRALCANFPKFESALNESAEKNVGHRVIVGRTPVLSDDELSYPSGQASIVIAPVVAGAGGNVGRIFIGAALIAASFFIPPIGLIGTMTLGGLVGTVGVALALGGVAQLLAGSPDAPTPSEDSPPSYAFDGPANTTQQGQAVPVGYGRLIVGSAIVSAGIAAQDVVS